MKNFAGEILLLNRSDINTDEIIPAKYLVETKKSAMGPHLLEDLKLDGFDKNSEEFKNAKVIVSRKNFGCGSSREHAAWALEVNGINVVVAESYSRIFRQNMFNCGLLAIELKEEEIEQVFKMPKNTTANVDLDSNKISFMAGENKIIFNFELSEFDKELVKAGGWIEYADKL